MKRVDSILSNPLYQSCLQENNSAEADRRFCRHNMEHFLDVARIARILNLEEERGVSEEYIYAASLLHDIGRFMQYQQGIPHEKASAELAQEILTACGFTEEERLVITEAICSHRERETAQESGLKGLLYRADKLSRPCFCCEAEAECNWKQEKKNLKLRY